MYTYTMTRHYLIKIFLFSCLILSVQFAYADDDYMEAKYLQDAGEILPLEIILKNIRVSYPGTILEIELEKEDGKIVYEMEILNKSGVVNKIYIDAKSGKVLSVKEED